jgi:hypothetical protein
MEHRQKPNRTLLKIYNYFPLTLCPLENSFVRNMDKLSDTYNHIEKAKSYSAVEAFSYLLQLKVLKFTCGIGLTMAHLLLKFMFRNFNVILFSFP